jgi:hypothetical protein
LEIKGNYKTSKTNVTFLLNFVISISRHVTKLIPYHTCTTLMRNCLQITEVGLSTLIYNTLEVGEWGTGNMPPFKVVTFLFIPI